MGAQSALSYNPAARQSGNLGRNSANKRRSESLKLAARLASELGIPSTWPNVQTIRLAIECEATCSNLPLARAAELILKAAQEVTPRPRYSCPSEWEIREIAKLNTINRFWFEDARWRDKAAYVQELAG